jgi:aryl-alcohol dehydrogenase-like predicted oxidoreductase
MDLARGVSLRSGAGPIEPESVIVNYYALGSTMGGHIDDGEEDLDAPLVSVSLGRPAIFLIGGKTKAELPSAIWLRSGDVVIMSGRARRCVHGVPRILEPCEDTLAAASVGAAQGSKEGAIWDPQATDWPQTSSEAERRLVCDYICTHRINLNIRQVRSGHSEDLEVGPLSRIALGTVQLGLDYGVANERGMPSETEAFDILREASNLGVCEVDTARAYGRAEKRLATFFASLRPQKGGDATLPFNVVTKIAHMPLDGSLAPEHLSLAVSRSVSTSSHELGLSSLPVVLAHSYAAFRNTHVWSRLKALKAQGVVARIGASVYTPKEAIDCLTDPALEFLQIPFNILDWRWRDPEVTSAFQARPDVAVRARSMFLQGLVFLPVERWPAFEEAEGFDPAALVQSLAYLRKELGRASVVELCAAYALADGHSWIGKFVLGVDSAVQLRQNAEAFRAAAKRPMTAREVEIVHAKFPRQAIPVQVVSPNLWPPRKV